ncbi:MULTISPECIES: bifunctional UDP-N-acetylglucosamine diphosphorylase/glucosamine-1-phosphate N-acetyltransferase GlmU [Collinsella]|uniref:bifunctional UDP-N-acetylglucosamine diphosphorylase/glucosamine-1-phosphate N-acetyltransferase GlmU n=1 Tax=Collinsella TaxID=102106 RepID=UPI000B39E079|nr:MULTISPECIES: bifunctional UDP-N-acetylglucosamine diphosphorylase/glucosamine-1-phosphate N-acetyltransferase GlmU [Collinsella]MBM6683938.1 bifunctional UDP-N-acetylglucosamine diphosphorylase/glucosamine-1-phosphate N-acetyltransferase GlmU [Collinsella intestinalis]OUN46494.1 UDP-N-acetylglucosamine diphosphorylase/glucosamine-1-phosphate N-acetyltransferase [Collinsella sp. An7]
MDATVIILAAGEGTRMKSNHAKVSHRILAKPMIRWIVDASLAAGAQRVVTVVGSHGDEVRALLEGIDGVECVEQAERLGTGHAVKVAIEACGISEGPVVVLNGDLPLIEPRTIRKFADTVAEGRAAAAVLTMTPPDPFGYGRIELNDEGQVLRIIEQKDCTNEQAKTLLECNAGCYAFDGAALAAHVGEIGCDNAQHEYYLPDMLEILRHAGKPVTYFHCNDFREGLGVNSRAQLAELTALARDRINARLMAEGVTMIDPSSTWVGPDAQVGRDTIIYPSTMIMGTTQIGEECIVGPNTRLMDTRVGNHSVIDETVAENVQIDDYVSCGPRAYLRPGTHLCDHSKAGTHVEIKKSTIGVGSKVPHLSYIGDTTMGANVNIGAGSITCNYDGVHKNATTIGDNTFIGSDTMMVAPVNIGADAVTGAGGTITKDVPDGALALERTEQRIIPGYTERKRARQQGK